MSKPKRWRRMFARALCLIGAGESIYCTPCNRVVRVMNIRDFVDHLLDTHKVEVTSMVMEGDLMTLKTTIGPIGPIMRP